MSKEDISSYPIDPLSGGPVISSREIRRLFSRVLTPKKGRITRNGRATKGRPLQILVWGLGVNQGGVGMVEFLMKFHPNVEVRVTDLKQPKDLKTSLEALKKSLKDRYSHIKFILGEHRPEDFQWADVIVRNPAVHPRVKLLQEWAPSKPILMESQIFFSLFRGMTVGITGTKGKSTTTFLTYTLLERLGKLLGFRVELAGNIGKSMVLLLDNLPDVVVLELSSFQLAAMHSTGLSPAVGTLTNIYPEHLNWHGTYEDYIRSKLQIAGDSTAIFVYNPLALQDEAARTVAEFVTQREGLTVAVGLKADDSVLASSPVPSNVALGKVVVTNSHVMIDEKAVYSLAKLSEYLRFSHNIVNLQVALETVVQSLLHMGVDIHRISESDWAKAFVPLETFQGLHGRNELVGKKQNIYFFNDTAATHPQGALATLRALVTQGYTVVPIMGGVDKGAPYDELVEFIDKHIKDMVLLEGSASEILRKMIKTANVHGFYGDFQKAIEHAYDIARSYLSSKHNEIGQKETDSEQTTSVKGVTNSKSTVSKIAVVLVPAAASFNMFQNEWDRGRQFVEGVRRIIKLQKQ